MRQFSQVAKSLKSEAVKYIPSTQFNKCCNNQSHSFKLKHKLKQFSHPHLSNSLIYNNKR